ncbi:DNA-binding response regulator [Mariprofundus sp. EBB-1]|uniref:response regulator n=1 Tax=Mariprofundus sp. EBB-1 TaxID=2650971 RepID=UPI000EF17693|nr:response regulator transcription factor [Mariprofundus sp. EBB-1]RLL50637.1 DNA-binding response regulator [Mariprofundus sp. EBB-1]
MGDDCGVYSVLIVEDEPATNAVLTQIVCNQKNLRHIASPTSIKEALPYLKSPAKIILIDIGLPDGSGIELIGLAKANNPDAEILVITTFGDEKNVLMAIQAGATGYLLKDQSFDDIELHIQQVILGESPLSPAVARFVLQSVSAIKPQQNAPDLKEHGLTSREIMVLDVLARGCSRLETAEALGLSPHTITSHTKNIYKKLSVTSRTEAIFEASQLGLI